MPEKEKEEVSNIETIVENLPKSYKNL